MQITSGFRPVLRRLILVLLLVCGAWSQVHADTYTFSSPPRLGAAASRALFAPLMEVLTKGTGESFVYVHPDSWFSYQSDVRKGRFALLLDDAHMAAWRIASRGDVPLVRARQRIRFVLVAVRDGRIYSKEDLIGQPVCAYPPPDLGTVSLLRKFNGPFQVPRIVATAEPIDRVRRLLVGDCAGAVLPRRFYTESEDLRLVAHQLEIITQTDPYPGITLTAAAALPPSLRKAIRDVLLSRSGERATTELRARLAGGDTFVAATKDQYNGIERLLRSYPGFGE